MSKQKEKYYLLIFLVFLFFYIPGYCQDGDSLNSVMYDSSEIELRMPSNEKIAGFKHDNDFVYENDFPKTETLWDRIMLWLKQKIGEYIFDKDLTAYIFYFVVLIAFIFLILNIINTKFRNFFFIATSLLSLL